mgnify:CR=1 FL=1
MTGHGAGGELVTMGSAKKEGIQMQADVQFHPMSKGKISKSFKPIQLSSRHLKTDLLRSNSSTGLQQKSTEDDEDEVWILRSHYTIPYGKDTVAKIALRCDERGCVAVPAKAVASAKTAA